MKSHLFKAYGFFGTISSFDLLGTNGIDRQRIHGGEPCVNLAYVKRQSSPRKNKCSHVSANQVSRSIQESAAVEQP